MNALSRRNPAGAHGAFTLIEMIISGALMSIILASAYVCLSASFSTQRLVDSRSDAIHSARAALTLIAADIRGAVPLSKNNEFVGVRRQIDNEESANLDFASRNYIPQRSAEPDYCEVSYFVERDPETKTFTLYRRRDPTPDPEPFSGGTREEIARGLLSFRLEYYDGYDWYDDWGDPTGKKRLSTFPEPNVSGLPEAVRITLSIDPAFGRHHSDSEERKSAEPPLTFQTTARVAMSLFFYRASGGASSPNSASLPEGVPAQ